MSPLDAPPAPTAGTLAELPMLRPCAKLGDSSKLTPRRLPPCEGFSEAASPRRFGGDVRSPAAPLNLTPRPPAEGPEGRSARRRNAGATAAPGPEERKVNATSLPPVPLTAREARSRGDRGDRGDRERHEDFGASGSSMASGASASRRAKDLKERRKPPMPKAPSPKDEVSSRASSSQGRPSSGVAALWDLDLTPELFSSEQANEVSQLQRLEDETGHGTKATTYAEFSLAVTCDDVNAGFNAGIG
eukprot:s748_g5.t1